MHFFSTHLHAALGPLEQLGVGGQVAEGHLPRHRDQARQREVNQRDLQGAVNRIGTQ